MPHLIELSASVLLKYNFFSFLPLKGSLLFPKWMNFKRNKFWSITLLHICYIRKRKFWSWISGKICNIVSWKENQCLQTNKAWEEDNGLVYMHHWRQHLCSWSLLAKQIRKQNIPETFNIAIEWSLTKWYQHFEYPLMCNIAW